MAETSRISAQNLRERAAEVVSRAAYGKERIILTRHGKDLAAIVPLEDALVLDELDSLEDAEDRRALAAARAEYARGETVPLADVLRRLRAK